MLWMLHNQIDKPSTSVLQTIKVKNIFRKEVITYNRKCHLTGDQTSVTSLKISYM